MNPDARASAVRILAIDTSTWVCTVALVRAGAVLGAHLERVASNHAGVLPALVERVLAETGERLEPGDAVAVAIGPGSFTGLRISLSFAKGLAFAGGLRVVGVPTLDALALAAPAWDGRLCTVLDARKQEVYAALYERDGDGIVRVGGPRTLAATRLAAALGDAPCTFIGDAVEAYGDVFRQALGARARLLSPADHPPQAWAVARLAAGRLAATPAGDDLTALVPDYLRPPEAELKQSAVRPSDGPEEVAFVDKVPLLY